jgi:hypothetical protein
MVITTLDRPLAAVERPVVLTRMERQKVARRRHPGPLAPLVVALATLALRLATAATGPTDWDSAQFAAATSRFDVRHGQPQPPGYWLYVETGRLVHQLTGLGVIHALVLVSALASATAAGLVVMAGRDLGGRWVGLAAGVVVALSPFAWFSGSIASTYSFDMVACSLLIVLAWRARPGSWHGIGAIVALGLLAGFRQSIIQAFLLLAVIAIVASTRRWGRLVTTVLAGIASVAVWLIPMLIVQPGGLTSWLRATHAESFGALQTSSVLDQANRATTNLGTFAAFTVVALAPLAVIAAVGGLALLIRGQVGSWSERRADPWQRLMPTPEQEPNGGWARPWHQSRWAILVAATVPAVLLVALVQFAKGGYVLAYFPAAVIALLLPLGALNRRRRGGDQRGAPANSPVWLTITTLAVAVVAIVGAQRFWSGAGVLPERWVGATAAHWIGQPRYQAPYADTRAAIRSADSVDAALAGLGPLASAANDVVAFDTVDGGTSIYRNAGWELAGHRVALIEPGRVLYNEIHGALYYASGATMAVGPAGSVLLVGAPSLPGLAQLVSEGRAVAVATPQPIAGYQVFQVLPGTSILGVQVTEHPGRRPLGSGI